MTESDESEVPVVQSLIRVLNGQDSLKDSADAMREAEHVLEAMRSRLSAVLGAGGYSTLLARTIALSRNDIPWLNNITPDKTGALRGLAGVIAEEQAATETARGFSVLLTRFAELMTTFIGSELTNRLLDAVLKDLSGSTTDINRGENNL